jgi:drug/metabolite transporter (DMT)-like permease
MWVMYGIALLCVIGLVIGQLLFKFGAVAWSVSGTLMNGKVMISILLAMLLYAATSMVWIWLLRKIELGRIYPLMALAFILVPLGSYVLFGERFNASYYFGIGMIVIGVALAAGSGL